MLKADVSATLLYSWVLQALTAPFFQFLCEIVAS